MLRSRANTLLSVRRVTEVNAGRKTAGVDGKVALLAAQKAELADWVQHRVAAVEARAGQAGVHTEGQRTKQRPLGIPVIADRALQALTVRRAGAGVGGTVRAEVLRISPGPWLPRRDRGDLLHGGGANPQPSVGARR